MLHSSHDTVQVLRAELVNIESNELDNTFVFFEKIN